MEQAAGVVVSAIVAPGRLDDARDLVKAMIGILIKNPEATILQAEKQKPLHSGTSVR